MKEEEKGILEAEDGGEKKCVLNTTTSRSHHGNQTPALGEEKKEEEKDDGRLLVLIRDTQSVSTQTGRRQSRWELSRVLMSTRGHQESVGSY